MDSIIDRFICVCNSIQPDNRAERTSGADHPWDCYRWRLEVSDTVCNSKAIWKRGGGYDNRQSWSFQYTAGSCRPTYRRSCVYGIWTGHFQRNTGDLRQGNIFGNTFERKRERIKRSGNSCADEQGRSNEQDGYYRSTYVECRRSEPLCRWIWWSRTFGFCFCRSGSQRFFQWNFYSWQCPTSVAMETGGCRNS